jgi:LytS/YehU family sensor histidine kinase
MLIAFFGAVALTMLISPVFSTIEIRCFQNFLPDSSPNHFIILNLIYDLTKSFIIFLTSQAISTAIRNREVLLDNQRILFENQTLAAENIKNRYEALKNQLNPHFLFNTLNTLDGLIGFGNEKAHVYLQNLSSSFRYVIQNKEITTLKEELTFAETFTYLMKIRYGDNLNIWYAIDEKYNSFYIMPLTLQLLIENAVKHNVIDDEQPLTIFVETTENDTIKVSNTIQRKIHIDAGERVGLTNLVERYRLLFGVDVLIAKNGVWEVEIPLIEKI